MKAKKLNLEKATVIKNGNLNLVNLKSGAGKLELNTDKLVVVKTPQQQIDEFMHWLKQEAIDTNNNAFTEDTDYSTGKADEVITILKKAKRIFAAVEKP